jgi:hypothetical protein
MDFLLGLLGIAMVAGGGYYYTARSRRWAPLRLRSLLVAMVGGFAVYNYLALGLPGAAQVMAALGMWAGPAAGLAGATMGLAGFLLYEWWRS